MDEEKNTPAQTATTDAGTEQTTAGGASTQAAQTEAASGASTAMQADTGAPAAAEGNTAAAEAPASGASAEGQQAEGEAAASGASAAAKTEKPATEELPPEVGVLTDKLAQAELRAAAAAAGVPAGKLAYVVRMCDRAALCKDGADMTALAAAQVQQLLTDVPELNGSVQPPVPGVGDHKRVNADPAATAAAEFAKYL